MRRRSHGNRRPLTVVPAMIPAVVLAACDARAPAAPPAGEVRVVVIAPEADTALHRGALLAQEEFERAAALMQRAVRVEVLDSVGAVPRAPGQTLILIGASSPPSCAALSEAAERLDALVITIRCAAQSWRNATAHPRLFHVGVSEAMSRGIGAGRADGDTAAVRLWDAAREPFGAAQLNARFAARFHAPMTDDAWAAWMAVRIATETALRAPRSVVASTPTLQRWLEQPRTRFDGHKGEPLRFGADDHQLQQPVYATGDAHAPRTAAEPDARRWSGVPARGSLVVVTNEGSSSLSVIDPRVARVVGVLPLPGRPRGVQAARDGRHVFVALSDANAQAVGEHDGIAVVDVRAGRIDRTLPAGSDPEQFALVFAAAERDAVLISANEDAGLATITGVSRGDVLASLSVGIEPEGVAVRSDGLLAAVTAETSNTVSIIDLARRVVVDNLLADVRPRAAVFSADGSALYVTNEISGTVVVARIGAAGRRWRSSRDTVITLGAGTKPVGIVLSAMGHELYVACGGAQAVSIIDLTTLRERARIPVGRRPWNLAASADGRSLYVANGASGTVSIVDLTTSRVVQTVPVGERPWGVAVVR